MRRALSLVIAFLLLPAAGVALARDTYPRSSTVDAIHYRISIEISAASDQVKAETAILLEFKTDGVKEAALDFSGLTIDAVTENDRAAKYTRVNGRVIIALEGSYRRGDRCRLAIKYHGKPADGLYIKKNKFGDPSVFADNWPDRAHYWFPSIDHPYDKATVEFLVVAPANYDIVANGALAETTARPDGSKLTHWIERVAIPTYCMVIGATGFSVINANALDPSNRGVPLSYYLYPRDRDHGVKGFGRAAEMIEFYSNLIAPYPYEKLALVQSSTRFGGMENSSAIFFDEKLFDDSADLEGVVAHEIAHQWFGDSVTEADWHHVWLSESFAQYFGHLFFERADGRQKFVSLMLADKESYLKAYASDPRPMYDPAITDLFALLNRNTYEKGAWVLHMLRRVMGDEKFFAGIRDYYRRHREGNALTADFQKVMESHAGMSLDWFFDEWFYQPGYPILEATSRWDGGSKTLTFNLKQSQPKTVYRMPIDLEIKTDGATRREVLQVNQREQKWTFKLDSPPMQVALDPDEWVLKVATVKRED
ncbi:MAG TPA: M1 family aminopeptidase [Blastocatellia bacterium]|nr:M1 family aminopeptidase [Blastocatellia bacterium]